MRHSLIAAQVAVLATIYRRSSLDCLVQQNEEAQRDELFGQSSATKSGRVNIEERRRQRAAAQRNAASRIGEGLAGESLHPHPSPAWLSLAPWRLLWVAALLVPVHTCPCASAYLSATLTLVSGDGMRASHTYKIATPTTCKRGVRVLQMGDSACCADEDREEIQEETQKQEDTFDQIGCALGDLKHMSHVSPLPS